MAIADFMDLVPQLFFGIAAICNAVEELPER